MSTPRLPSRLPLRIPADTPYLTTREQATDLNSQEHWAKPLIAAYRTARGHGQAILDAYLNGLFIAYHDRFRCTLGTPSNTQDQASVMQWKQCALDHLAKLMFTVHSMEAALSSQVTPSQVSRTQVPFIDLKSSARELDILIAELPPSSPVGLKANNGLPPPEATESKTVKLPTLQELLGERKRGAAPSVYSRMPLKDRLESISAMAGKLIENGGRTDSAPSGLLKRRLSVLAVVSTTRNVRAHDSSVSNILRPTMPPRTALNAKPRDEESPIIISSFVRKSRKRSRSSSEIPEEESIKVKRS
ncbi:hypothetical protein EDD18DRAFT_1416591 [Armillaria luteobubalina]|uniref:Uncharacterized protein n=1 Tax=Armillaria luteobubalina TaxID=153913 RepID=A0AA39UJC0_9AGAR|nr:hypothetical protein EDD18DRAFT_1416591 [Armillaria luteobubalina]